MLLSKDSLAPVQICSDNQGCVIRVVWQLADNALGKLGFLRIEHAGADRHANTIAQRALDPQLFTSTRCIGGDRSADRLDVMPALAERAAAADRLFLRRRLF